MSILKVAALATLSLISVLQEQITALSTVQANHLNVYPASWIIFFSIVSLLLTPELMILQQCLPQQRSPYPVL